MPHLGLLAVVVDDYDRAIDHYVDDLGFVLVEEPRDEPYGTVAVFRDRFGNLWDLLQPVAR